MLKRFLNSFAGAAGWSAGTVIGARGGNDAYDWVKSGEAREALGRLGQKTTKAAREVKGALADAAENAGEAVEGGVQTLQARFSIDEAGAEEEARTVDQAAEGDLLSEDDRAALQARRRATMATVIVRCTHCDKPVQVQQDAELARCSACDRRFWIELAERG